MGCDMSDLPNRVDLNIKDISPAHGTTRPRLDVEVSANPSNNNIVIQQISPSLTFQFPKNNKHIEGPIPTVPLAQTSEFERRGSTFKLYIEFSRHELDTIEEYREGGDIELELNLWIVGNRNDNREEGRFELSEELIDGEWTRILDAFDYHDKRDVELNLDVENPRIRDRLITAHGKIERAQQKHDTGDYPSAVTECRRAIEALRSIEETSDVLHERKYDDLDDIMGKFEKGFAGGLAHAEEKTNITPALRRDSEFALNLTKACARYISTALEEGGDV
jgi:hypothetical protein